MKTEFFNVTRPLEVMWRLAFTEQKILWKISISTILFDKKTNEICLQLKRGISARLISTTIAIDVDTPHETDTTWVAIHGQFVDHDLTSTPSRTMSKF